VKFLDDAGIEYTWKNNKPGLALQLFGRQSKTLPVARFIRTYKDYKIDRENPPVVPSTLLLDESVEPIRDFILVSFLPWNVGAARPKRPPLIAPKPWQSTARTVYSGVRPREMC